MTDAAGISCFGAVEELPRQFLHVLKRNSCKLLTLNVQSSSARGDGSGEEYKSKLKKKTAAGKRKKMSEGQTEQRGGVDTGSTIRDLHSITSLQTNIKFRA